MIGSVEALNSKKRAATQTTGRSLRMSTTSGLDVSFLDGLHAWHFLSTWLTYVRPSPDTLRPRTPRHPLLDIRCALRLLFSKLASALTGPFEHPYPQRSRYCGDPLRRNLRSPSRPAQCLGRKAIVKRLAYLYAIYIAGEVSKGLADVPRVTHISHVYSF